MEKNQQNREWMNSGQQNESLPVAAPGQEVPKSGEVRTETAASEKKEQHSESSLPEKDNETLGTP